VARWRESREARSISGTIGPRARILVGLDVKMFGSGSNAEIAMPYVRRLSAERWRENAHPVLTLRFLRSDHDFTV